MIYFILGAFVIVGLSHLFSGNMNNDSVTSKALDGYGLGDPDEFSKYYAHNRQDELGPNDHMY